MGISGPSKTFINRSSRTPEKDVSLQAEDPEVTMGKRRVAVALGNTANKPHV